MKSLYESLLDDEETITGTLVEEQIEEWLRENCKITGTYKIFQEDNTYYVDINGNVDITNKSIKRFPTELFRFNKVSDWFDCVNCIKLESLEGAPSYVGGSFDCSWCIRLITLEGSPIEVKRSYYCDKCISLESVKGIPKKIGNNMFIEKCDKLLSKYPDIESEVRKYSIIKEKVF